MRSEIFSFKSLCCMAIALSALVLIGGVFSSAYANNHAPTISTIADQMTDEDVPTSPISFTVGDIETLPTSLIVTASSSDTALVQNSEIVVGGAGSSRTLIITPAPLKFGACVITLTVTDSNGAAASTSFVLTVNRVNHAPTITGLPSLVSVLKNTQTTDISFTIGDIDAPVLPTMLTVTIVPQSTTLVPNDTSHVNIGGMGVTYFTSMTSTTRNISMLILPGQDQYGISMITVKVSDGITETTGFFYLKVDAVNYPPTISTISDQTINAYSTSDPIAFTVGDRETPAANLTVTATSSDTTFVPNANISIGGSGTNRTLTIIPLPLKYGTCVITTTVTDVNSASANTNFTLTVKQDNHAPTITGLPITPVIINENGQTGDIPFIIGDVDRNSVLTVTITPQDTTLLPNDNAHVDIGGMGASCSTFVEDTKSIGVKIIPTSGKNGYTLITVTVRDSNNLSSTGFFYLLVNPINQPPIISGYIRDSANNIGISGVTLDFSNSGGTVTTDSSGSYSKTVNSGWTGAVTPSKSGYSFTPSYRSYSTLTANQTNQDYTGLSSTRIINLTGSLAFGNVNVGATKQLTFTIGNSGNSTLTVSSITYPTGFSGNWSGGAIAAGGSQTVTVTFAPNAVQSYSGTVTVNSDKTSGTNTIAISGTGTQVPISYTISGYAKDSNNIGIGGVTLTFSNSGGTATTETSGFYSKAFTAVWTGMVIPSKSGYNFTPANLSYSNVTTDQANQNYTASNLKPIISVTPESHDFGDIPLKSSMSRSARRSSDRAKRSDPQIQLSSEYIENQVIIKIRPALRNTTREQSIMTSLNANILAELPSVGAQVWQISGTVQDALNQYWNNPNIEYIEPNYIIRLNKTPNDPFFSELWGLNNTGQSGGRADADIDAPEAWDISTGGNVVVAVIDTGVDYNHPDLAANMWKNPGEIPNNGIDDDHNGYIDDVYGYDFANNDGDPYDDNRHGTHCAGTIAGSGNNGMGVTGVSWSAKIMALKFLTASGSGSTSAAIKAVEYATKMGAKITSNSWGGGGYSSALYEAIQAAEQAECLFIAAAGNGGLDGIGDDNDAQPNYPSNYALNNIIAVASTDRNDIRSYFSNYGLYSVDLGAPGSSIYSTVPGNSYSTFNGTSMATPHVSGVASLIWSAYPSLTAAQVKEALLSSVDPITALQGKTVSGGRLNAYNALMRAGQNQKTFTVSNTGNSSLIIGSLSVTGTNKSDFLIQNDTCSGKTISSNGNCTVKVVFAPAAVGTKTAYLSIPSNDSNAPVVNATLLGRGIGNDNDNDGMSNSFESQYGFNLNNIADALSDYDNDGLSNLSEYKMGTNPIRKDTDADGMPDGYEAVHSFDPLNPFDAQSDPDRDGLTNFQEYQGGTEPVPTGLSDVIKVLRVLTGISDGNALGINDVNSDNKIGLEEVIYILQKVAGLR